MLKTYPFPNGYIMNAKCDHTRLNCEHHDNITGKLNAVYSHCTFTENLLLADGGIPLLKSGQNYKQNTSEAE